MFYLSRKWYYWIETVSDYWKNRNRIANKIIKNRVDHGYDSPEIEISYGGERYEMDILKFNHT